MSFDHDVAIVGGGPAGSSTALHLVRTCGIDPKRVLVVDKARFPREKPCAGAISHLGVEELAAIGVDVAVPNVAMQGVRVLSAGDVGETFSHMGVVVRRSEFDARLLDETRRDGVEVRDGEGLIAIAREDRGWRLTTSGRTITARYVAACDGAGSTTRKLLGLREPERKGHLYVLETAPNGHDGAMARGLVDFDLSVLDEGLQGYYWDFPTIIEGKPYVSRGIYHANLEPSSDVKKALAKELAKRDVDIAKVKLKPFSTRPFVPGTQTWIKRMLLVGEAAGIDHTTGEGIAQAIAMAGIAARHLAEALRTDGSTFDNYDRDVRHATFGRHLLQSAWLAKRVYGRFGAPARNYLLRSTFARDAAMAWYRGETLSMFTQLRLGLGLVASAL
ncbi:MAG TPA: NAD(P)/FAD-dependent oxidoreductase [Labilithrix sp.]